MARDPGTNPNPATELNLCILWIKCEGVAGRQDWDPDFIVNNKIKIDYTHYITNQIMKPIQQLGLALEQIWEYQNKHSTIRKYKQELTDIDRGPTIWDVWSVRRNTVPTRLRRCCLRTYRYLTNRTTWLKSQSSLSLCDLVIKCFIHSFIHIGMNDIAINCILYSISV
jgi:hypothetical protein